MYRTTQPSVKYWYEYKASNNGLIMLFDANMRPLVDLLHSINVQTSLTYSLLSVYFSLHFSVNYLKEGYKPYKHICASLVTVYFFRNNK